MDTLDGKISHIKELPRNESLKIASSIILLFFVVQ